MKIKSYGSIYIGTFEMSMKIYEIVQSSKSLKMIDDMRYPVQIASDIQDHKYLKQDTVKKICDILKDMKDTMENYRVPVYEIFVNHAVKDASNYMFLMDQIRLKLGIPARIITNSQKRFYSYEALASMKDFPDMIRESALIADVGGNSIQLTLFNDSRIVTTQHIMLGVNTIKEKLDDLSQKSDGRAQVMEMITKEIMGFSNMYLKNISLKYLILLNDSFIALRNQFPKRHTIPKFVPGANVKGFMKDIGDENFFSETFSKYHVDENESMNLPFLMLYDGVIRKLDFKNVFVPGISIHEGFTLNACYRSGTLKAPHDFDEDVMSAAWAIAGRYGSYKPHVKMMDKIVSDIFDTIKKRSGLKERDRLVLRVAAVLHDCGKYISLADAAKCSYAIIMSSEILGLTHDERKMAALISEYNHSSNLNYSKFKDKMSEEDYMTFLKLLAILRVANALDSSHKQKLKDMSMRMRDDTLYISVSSEASINLEKGYFEEKADFFENVFAIRPVIRLKKNY